MTPRARTDDDTDPEGPSRSGSFRLQPTTPEEGAISRDSRGAFRLGLLVIGIAVGLGGLVTADRYLAVAAAQTVVDARVAPLEKRFSDHEAADRGERDLAALRAKQIADGLERIEGRLAAICRAMPRPQVCLGGE